MIEKTLRDYTRTARLRGQERTRTQNELKIYLKALMTKALSQGELDRDRAIKLMNTFVDDAGFRGVEAQPGDDRHVMQVIDLVFPN